MKSEFKQHFYRNFIISIIIPTVFFAMSFAFYYDIRVISRYENDSKSLLNSVTGKIEYLIDDVQTTLNSSYLHSELYKCLEHFAKVSEDYNQVEINEIEAKYIALVYKILFGGNQDYEAISFFPKFRRG